MIITCPHCKTHFRLADEKVRENVRARCSVCNNVFVLSQDFIDFYAEQDKTADDSTREDVLNHKNGDLSSEISSVLPDIGKKVDSAEESQNGFSEGSRSQSWLWLFFLTLILVAGVVYYLQPQWLNTGYLHEVYEQVFGAKQVDLQNKDLVGRIAVKDYKYETLQNEQTGTIGIITGVLVNNGETPCSLIRVEAVLKDADDRVIEAKTQTAGNTLTLLQLQTLPKEEIESALNNEAGVRELNGNVSPKGEVPFMLVFYNPSQAVKYTIKVVDARIPSADKQ